MAIAKDVLAQLKAGKYNVITVNYLEMGMYDKDRINQKILQNARCNVCAAGAAFASAIRLFDGFETANGAAVFDCETVLIRYFSKIQIAMIESAFMRSIGSPLTRLVVKDTSHDDILKASAFGAFYPSKYNRIVAIFKNIIANEGTFKP